MRRLLPILLVTLAVLLGSAGVSWSADYEKGVDAYGRGDYATAVREFRTLAEQGNAYAQTYLGVMYDKGNGVPKNHKTAVKWYRLAAEQGLAVAQFNLGAMYENGRGVPLDYKTAVKWYRLAAEQGDVDAQYNLGLMYANGEGVPQNDKTAVKWYSLAAYQGHSQALSYLAAMYDNEDGVPQDDKIAEQKSSPTVTTEKSKPKLDKQHRLELARRTQEALEVLGLYSGKLDGIIGVKTKSAIQQWQKRNGYAGTGEITKVQLAKLEQEAITQLSEKKPEPKVTAEKTPRLKKKKPDLAAIPSIEFGDYHALVIGNDNYPHMNNLENAVQDAKDVSSVLKRLYGFQVQTLLNATRSDIFGALESYRTELTSDSNLLIYYAGHGYVDGITGTGYWQPVDSDEISKSNWIPNSVVTNELKAIRAKHVMVIADSCYSGTLVRSSTKGRPTAKDTEWYKRMAGKRSRTALVSGGIEPVMVGGGGKNSVFAKALLDVLKENQSIMDGAEVFERLKRPVVLASEQTPEYADIRLAGHDGGHFLLVRQDAITEQPNVSKGADALEQAKKQCSELGFTKGTVEHGQCVMKLYK